MSSKMLKRLMISSLVLTTTLFGLGLGGCSLRSIGAGLLSEYLISGEDSTLGTLFGSGLSELLSQITGATS